MNHTFPPTSASAPVTLRTGADYLATLSDGRDVRVDGVRVDDLATHPAFAGMAATMAAAYDAAHEPDSALVDPTTGHLALFTIPRGGDLHTLRKRALEEWTGLTDGFIGRGPDHVAGLLAGFAGHAEAFAPTRDDLDEHTAAQDFPAHVRDFHAYAASRGLWISNSIVPPQQNLSDPTSRVKPVQLLEVTAEGIVVDGAQMLGTGAAVADEIFVTSVRPLGPNEQAKALSFVLPVNSPGLTLVCRRPYATAGEEFDYPLSNRYDETDAMVVFDRVLVPWWRVFAAGDVGVVNRQFFGTAAHQIGNFQSLVRLTTKLQFLVGVASAALRANGRENDMALKMQLADIASLHTVSKSLMESAHAFAAPDEQGVWRPEGQYLYAALGMQTEVYPKAVKLLGELVGGGVIQVPGSVLDFDDASTVAAMDVVMGSDQLPVKERVRLFKLCWDLIGSEFAGRHVQYERFYSGAAPVVKGYAHRHYPFAVAEAQVDAFLAASGR